MINFKDKNMEFKEVDSIDEISQLFNLRFQNYESVFHDGKSIKESMEVKRFKEMLGNDPFNGAYEIDKYDFVHTYSNGWISPTTHFVAKQEDKVIGTVRLIRDNLGIPYDEDFDRDMKGIVEISRLTTGKLNAIPGLFRCVMQQSLLENIPYMYIVSWNKGIELYKKIGFETIGESKKHYKFNDFVVPMRMDISNLKKNFSNMDGINKKVVEYFFREI